MKRTTYILTLFILSLSSQAQPPVKFLTRFGGNGIDVGYGVKQTMDGQYIVTGSTSSFGLGNTDVLLSKVDSMGWVRWSKSFGGFNNDIGRAIILMADSGFVMAGYTNSFGGGGYDMLLIRTDKDGNLKWQKAYGGIDWEFGYDVVQAPDGHLVICGSTYSSGYGKMDGHVIKADSANGNVIWKKTFGGAEDDEFKSILITYNAKIALAGTTKSRGDVKGDAWLFKLEQNGDSIMSFKYGDNRKQLINDFVELPDKGFYLCGATDKFGTDSLYSYPLKTDENGNFIFDNYFSKGTFRDQQFMAIDNAKNNEVILVEKGFNSPAGFKLEPTFCIFPSFYASACNTYGSNSDEIIYDIFRTRDKGYVAIGYTTGFVANLTDVFLVKMDSTTGGSNINAVGIKEQVNGIANELSVFPSLTNGIINVRLGEKPSPASINVYGTLGDLIYQNEVKHQNQSFDLSPLPDGFYYVTISYPSFSKTFKIVKCQ